MTINCCLPTETRKTECRRRSRHVKQSRAPKKSTVLR